MNVKELKSKIIEIFGSQILFNKEFDELAISINSPEDLFSWCILIKERKIPSISNAKLGEKIVFIKKIGSSNRCIIIKIRNGEFKEVHLGDHRYYNYLTSALGLKKSSNTY